MESKKPHPVDVYVGSRVRMRRVLLGMSQEKLGAQLGLTFQQVQKYEKGSNRVGASRLWEMSRILDVPVHYFYEGLNSSSQSEDNLSEGGQQDFVMDFVHSNEGLQLIKAFVSVEDARVRRGILQFVRTLAGQD